MLDDIERAAAARRPHRRVQGGGGQARGDAAKLGLEPFGHDGEAFDPSVHEAVQHDTSPDVAGPTVTAVLRRGYRFGDRVLRPALVAVTDHEPGAARHRPPRCRAGHARDHRRAGRRGARLVRVARRRRAGGSSERLDLTREEGTSGEREGLDREGLLPRAGRLLRRRRRGRSRRRTASSRASCTPTPTRATPRPRPASRRCPRPTACSADAEKRKQYDEARAAVRLGRVPAGGRLRRRSARAAVDVRLRRPVRQRPAGRAPVAGASATCSATCSAGGAAPRARRAGRGAAPTSRPRCASTSSRRSRARRCRCGCRRPSTCETCHGSGAKPGTTPRTCATCGGAGLVSRSQGAFAFCEPCRDCRGTGPDHRRPVPGVRRRRGQHPDPDADRADPRRRRRRPTDPARRAGRAGRERRARG